MEGEKEQLVLCGQELTGVGGSRHSQTGGGLGQHLSHYAAARLIFP